MSIPEKPSIDRNWEEIFEVCKHLILNGCPSWTELARKVTEHMGYRIPRSTLRDGLIRHTNTPFTSYQALQHYIGGDWQGAGSSGGWSPTFVVQDNMARATSASGRVKTLEQLLEAVEVDLDTWRVLKWGAKKWEGYAKREDTHLIFDHGRASGSIDRGGLEICDLWSVWADFVRIVPIEMHPAVQPIQAQTTYRKPPPPKDIEGIRRTLVFSDPQIGFHRSTRTAALKPFHSRIVLDVLLQIAAAAKVDRIDIVGDILDLPEWSSKFLTHPQFYWSTQPSLVEAHWHLVQFRKVCPDAEIKIHEGNHDKRMPDAIITHLPAAYELKRVGQTLDWPVLSIPYLLALDSLGIEWVENYPNDIDWLNKAVCIRHGDIARGMPMKTASAVAQNADTTEIFGHCHRLEWASYTKWQRDGPRVVVGFTPGCVCRIDGTVPGVRARQQWQNGCAIVDYDMDCMFSIAPILIERGRAMWDGHVFEGRNRLEDLKQDHPEWNW